MQSRVCLTMSLALVLLSVPAAGKPGDGPRYIKPPSSVLRPVDRTFDGVIDVHVDATDVQRRIFSVRQRIPIGKDGRMTLLYPRWEAASHGPSLSVTDLAGLAVEAAGRPLPWRRDPYEPHAFHVDVPPGTSVIEVRFQMVAGDTLLSPDVVSVPWQRLILYPAGWYARNIGVTPTLTLPSAMRAFTTLKVERSESATIRFARTTLDTLLDAPVLAGRYATQVPLTAAGDGAVSLDLVALRAKDLTVPPERLAELRRLIAQMRAVFGTAPFARYEILARLSDDGSSGGTEHRA